MKSKRPLNPSSLVLKHTQESQKNYSEKLRRLKNATTAVSKSAGITTPAAIGKSAQTAIDRCSCVAASAGKVGPGQMVALAKLMERLIKIPFTCSQSAIESQKILGGTIYGYFTTDNPTARLGQSEGGHDFLVLVDEDCRYILDIWGAAYQGTPLVLDFRTDWRKISVLYGSRSKWSVVET
jgi:hypothetical protein